MAAATHLVVDGSNIATEGRTTPSLRQLDEAVRALLADRSYDKVTVVVDATFGHRIDKGEQKMYEEAVLNGELVTPPAGAVGRGDAFVLQIADRANATVLSNDSFQEFHGTYAWLFEADRLIGGKPVPEVGWIFVPRVPVRGPASRRSVREARKPPTPTKSAKAPARPARPGAAVRAGEKRRPPVKSSPEEAEARRSEPRPDRTGPEPLNEPLAFIEFVAAHPVGSTVEGVVERFSSHGAYVLVDGARCYLPLKTLAVAGNPPPRSARDVLSRGERRSFVVTAVDTPRRGIDLALSGEDVKTESGGIAAAEAAAEAAGSATHIGHAEEAPVAPAAKKTAAKKTTARKTAAKKAPAKKTTAAKKTAATKRTPARKTTAAKKTTTTARKTAAKKTAAKKATTTARKAPAKKVAAAKKTTAKKTAATKRTPAKKATATTRKTAATKRTPAKKATAKKSTAKKTPAKRTAATKRTPATRRPAAKKS